MGAQTLAAGIYALFTIPSPNEWTILINKNWDQHLTDEYDPNADIIRVLIKPETLSDHQERLMYAVEKSGISLRWEKIRLFIPVSAN